MFFMDGDGWSVPVKAWAGPARGSRLAAALSVRSGVLQVRDEQHQCSLGNLKIPLSRLLTSDDMTINQRFQLSNSGPNSTLKMKIALRVRSPPRSHGWAGMGCSGEALGHCCAGLRTGRTVVGVVTGPGLAGRRRPTWQRLRVACAARNSLRLPMRAVGRFLSFGPEACCLDQRSLLLRLNP